MTTSQQARFTTRMFSRVLGPFWAVVSIAAAARASDMRTLLSGFEANGVWSWVTGAFILAGGLIIVALHPYWRNAPAVIVSLFGWILVLRGVLLLAFPAAFMSMADSVIGATTVWRTVYVCFAAIGLYLTYVGWLAPEERPVTRASGSTPDLPRAA